MSPCRTLQLLALSAACACAEGLVERSHVAIGKAFERTPAVTLTGAGKRLAEQESDLGNERRQEFHAGFVKPAELEHDLALYRVC